MSSCLRIPVAPGTSMPFAIDVSLEIDISLRSARFKKPSSLGSLASLVSFSGASAVTTVVPPSSSLLFALEARERVLCDISVHLLINFLGCFRCLRVRAELTSYLLKLCNLEWFRGYEQ